MTLHITSIEEMPSSITQAEEYLEKAEAERRTRKLIKKVLFRVLFWIGTVGAALVIGLYLGRAH